MEILKKSINILTAVILYALFQYTFISAEDKLPADSIHNSSFTVYIVNQNMHTGIVIPVEDIPEQIFPAVRHFRKYRFIDIGWGEERYYQKPDDSLLDGARAILLRNSSVIRIEGYRGTAGNFIDWSDYTIEITLSRIQYTQLLEFIGRSFLLGSDGEPVTASQKHSGSIIFFKSIHTYHLFNTCNTWVSDALIYAGLELPASVVVTRMQLYKQIQSAGRVIKKP